MTNVSVDKFFSKYIDGYLFGDLEAMTKIIANKEDNYGGVAYPMILTTLSGMELLGNLLMLNDSEFNTSKGKKYFLNFWKNYLTKQAPTYFGLGEVFYSLLRHGIAHTFLTKYNILISKGMLTPVEIFPQANAMRVDCIEFFNDFTITYKNEVIPLLNNPIKKELIQKRLNSLIDKYKSDSEDELGKYFKIISQHPKVPIGISIAQGTYPLQTKLIINDSLSMSQTGASGMGKSYLTNEATWTGTTFARYIEDMSEQISA